MGQLDTKGGEPPCLLVDLSTIEQSQRALSWDVAVRSAFPSLSVTLADPLPALGSINRTRMGSGEMFEIALGRRRRHPPCRRGRHGRGQPGDGWAAHLADGPAQGFDHRSPGRRQLPARGRRSVRHRRGAPLPTGGRGRQQAAIPAHRARSAALSRYPMLERLLVTIFPAEEPGTRMLADTLLRFSAGAAGVRETQRCAMMGAGGADARHGRAALGLLHRARLASAPARSISSNSTCRSPGSPQRWWHRSSGSAAGGSTS